MRKQKHGAASAAESSYWIYGNHAVEAAMANENRHISRIICTSAAKAKLDTLRDSGRHPAVEQLDPQAFAKLVPADTVNQGAAAKVDVLEQPDLHEILESAGEAPLVLLDQVTDPHNVGAILRSAAAFGAVAVVVTAHNSAHETATLAKSASGALEVVPLVTVSNLAQAMEACKKAGYWIAGFAGEATQTMQEAKLTRKTALVMGAEGKGMRRLTGENCDFLVRIPISSKMESLNVSNAAAVALYELARG